MKYKDKSDCNRHIKGTWDTIKGNLLIYVSGVPGEKRNSRPEAVFKEIMAKDFLKLIKDIKPQN